MQPEELFELLDVDELLEELLELLDDEELEAMLDKRESLSAAAKEYKEIDGAVKAAFKDKPCVLIGAWEITGKTVEKRGAKPYWLSKIMRTPPKEAVQAAVKEV